MQLVKQMVACRRCGKELEPKPRTSLSRGFLYLSSYPLRNPLGYIAAGFLIGGLITIGVLVGTTLASHNFWLQILSLSALAIAAFILMMLLFTKWRRSRVSSLYCPDCAFEIAMRQSQRPEEFMPHKVTQKKGKGV